MRYYQLDPTPVTNQGYKVKRSVSALSDEERRGREDFANKMIAEAIRKKR
jgi:hypothetical protein